MSLRLPLLLTAAFALLVIGVSAASANRGIVARVTWFEDPAHEAGTEVPNAYVVQQRGYFSITAQMHLKELTPGHRYTLWWVIYNNPSACVDGCDAEDVTAALTTGTNPVGIGVHYGGSNVVGSTGRLDVGTRILENSLGGCQVSPPYASLCEALIDAAIAEADLIIQDHGPDGDLGVFDVTDAFASGCRVYKRFDTVVATYGESGFDCFSPQAVHLP